MRKIKLTVLAIAEDAHTRDAVREGLTPRGFAIRIAQGASDGLSSFLKIKPDFVIISVSPLTNLGLMTLTDICEADPHARVITVSSCTDDAFAMECIRHGAMDYLKKPIEIRDLLRSIDRINNRRLLLKITSEPDVECVQEEDKSLFFGNDTDNLPYIINQAVYNAKVVCPDVAMLKMALGEIILNAIEHGNLNITMEEKASATEKGDYKKLLQERINDPRYADRVVKLNVHMTRNELVYTISDQGNGFDYKKIFTAEPHAHIGSGLGLFVARSFFTDITFKGRGNRVVLIYKKPSVET